MNNRIRHTKLMNGNEGSGPGTAGPATRSEIMTGNTQAMKGHWNEFRGLVKQRWGELTEDDLQLLEGNIEQMVGRIQQKTGEGREAIESFFAQMESRGSAAVAHAAQYAHQVGDSVRERYDRIEDRVKHDPATSIAMVFGVGIVAGLIAGLAIRHR